MQISTVVLKMWAVECSDLAWFRKQKPNWLCCWFYH